MQITWFGHSAFRLDFAGRAVLIDPFFTGNPSFVSEKSAAIKGVSHIVLTHGHGDHYGGVNYLTDKYPARVLMSGIDWDTVVAGELEFDFPNWGRPPKQGESVCDGDIVSLGSTDVMILLTPGHTRGTISLAVRSA